MVRDDGKPVRKNFLPIGRPTIGPEEINEVIDTLKSDWISKGPKTKRFENDFRKYIGCSEALALNSCTSALHIALKAFGITKGDEVITTPMTFVATTNAIIYCGATPVFVDVEKDTFNIDYKKIEAKITSKTKAILPVHFAGLPCYMDGILEIARKYKLIVIEDAAHALGAEYKSRKIGSIGDATAYSFYATKNITTGDGGMLVTDDEEIAAKAEMLSLHGLSTDAWKRYDPSSTAYYEMIDIGYKYNMTDIQAAIGIQQLKKIDVFIEMRQKYARMYDDEFSTISEISFQKNFDWVHHARHIYPIVIQADQLRINREEFIQALKAENIGSGIHYIAIFRHEYYRKRVGAQFDFPVTANISDNVLSLPLYPRMTEEDVYDVVKAVKKIIAKYRK